MDYVKNYWTRRQFMALSGIATLQLATSCATAAGVAIEGKPLHHTTKGYRNYPIAPEPENPGLSFFWRRVKDLGDVPEIPKNHVINQDQVISDFAAIFSAPSLTWIGHTTYLLRLEGKVFLLDPFFYDVPSPLPIGPKRYVPPAMSLAKLPAIDGIIISHNHYDHLDADVIERLPGKSQISVFVPLGLKSFFVKRGYEKVIELDWNQTAELEGVRLTALSAVHFSNRGLGDRNETLWCSWAIQTDNHSCYFAGDTAYSDVIFKDIGSKFGRFDLAIVPIGAYMPANVMKPVHTNPEEAIQVANDVKADLIIPSHWGTIVLTDEPAFEPPERYRKFSVKNGISDGRAAIMKIGETIKL